MLAESPAFSGSALTIAQTRREVTKLPIGREFPNDYH